MDRNETGPPPAGFRRGGSPPYPKQPGSYPPLPGYTPRPGQPYYTTPTSPPPPPPPPPQASYPAYPVYGGQPPGRGMPGYSEYNSPGCPEDPLQGNAVFDFSDKTVRRGFIRKVYGILMCQLLVTVGIIALFSFHEGTRKFVIANPFLLLVAVVIIIVCMVAMVCCGNVRRQAPMNFIFLGIFTLAESFLLGCTAAAYSPYEVFLAVCLCAVITFGLTLFAFQTKIDFTLMGGFLFVSLLILILFGIVFSFWPGKVINLVYSSLGALLFSLYIIYDTQIMMGGNHKYAISPEEYIFAALNLYLDIINLFLYILAIIGISRD